MRITDLPEISLADLPMAKDRTAGWKRLRELGRVVKIGDSYFLSHREDIEHALRNPQIYSSAAAFENLGSPLPLLPIAFDPPEHDVHRALLNPFFNPKVIAEVLPSLQSQIDEIMATIAAKPNGSVVEIMNELAEPYPSQVFLTFFGLPLEDRDQLISWKNAVIGQASQETMDGPTDAQPGQELFAYLTEFITRKRENPANDVLSQLVTGEDALDDSQALGLCFLLTLAGLDTVTSTIGFALEYLATHPGIRKDVMSSKASLMRFTEEIIRLQPPAPVVPRKLLEEVTIGDVTLPKGTDVQLALGSANRDPAEGDTDLDELRLDGPVRRSLGFGGGPHRCLGMHLARLELQLVLTAWDKAFSDYSLAPGFEAEIPWPSGVFGLDRLEIVTTAR